MKPKRKQATDKQEESKQQTNVNDNENDNENENKKPSYFMTAEDVQKKKHFVAPSLQEVETFFTENNFKLEVAQNAFHYYNEANWKDSRGKAIQNWKQKMRGVWFKDENKNLSLSKGAVYTAPKKYRPA
jgi:hypothetical protein